jgi:hypothetical protein
MVHGNGTSNGDVHEATVAAVRPSRLRLEESDSSASHSSPSGLKSPGGRRFVGDGLEGALMLQDSGDRNGLTSEFDRCEPSFRVQLKVKIAAILSTHCSNPA